MEPRHALPCSVEGCPNRNHARGMCSKHYLRQRVGIPLDAPDLRTDCTMEGCERRHMAKGLCKAHYMRQYAGVKTTEPLPPAKRCTQRDCERTRDEGTFCRLHAERRRKGRPLSRAYGVGRGRRPLTA